MQHERGPRKPKLHLLNAHSAANHHHSHHNHHHNSHSNVPGQQVHGNLLNLHHHHHHHSDSNHPLGYHHSVHLHGHFPHSSPTSHNNNNNNSTGNNNNPNGPLIAAAASFNYTAHLAAAHHHNQPPFTANFPHPPTNIHHPQPITFNGPINTATSLLAPHKLEPNQSSAFEVPPMTIKQSASDQESYTRKSEDDDRDSVISPTHTIKSSTSPSLSSPDHIVMVDRPLTLKAAAAAHAGHGPRDEEQLSPQSAESANLPTATAGGQRQSEVLEMLMRSDKCQEFLQYQMQNSILFPQSTPTAGFWPPPPPPLLPLSPNTNGTTANGLTSNSSSSTIPSPSSTHLPSWDVLQETTARLLFMAVRWVKCLVPFQTLSKADQHLLLQVVRFWGF